MYRLLDNNWVSSLLLVAAVPASASVRVGCLMAVLVSDSWRNLMKS